MSERCHWVAHESALAPSPRSHRVCDSDSNRNVCTGSQCGDCNARTASHRAGQRGGKAGGAQRAAQSRGGGVVRVGGAAGRRLQRLCCSGGHAHACKRRRRRYSGRKQTEYCHSCSSTGLRKQCNASGSLSNSADRTTPSTTYCSIALGRSLRCNCQCSADSAVQQTRNSAKLNER